MYAFYMSYVERSLISVLQNLLLFSKNSVFKYKLVTVFCVGCRGDGVHVHFNLLIVVFVVVFPERWNIANM